LKKAAIISYALLCGWFVLGYSGTSLTVETRITDLNVSTVLLFFLLWGLFGYIRRWKYNDLSALAVVMIWGLNQYFEHWQPLFFGATPERVRGYNNYFNGTARIFSANPNRIVPDVFHIIIGLLLVVCAILLLVNIGVLLRDRFRRRVPT